MDHDRAPVAQPLTTSAPARNRREARQLGGTVGSTIIVNQALEVWLKSSGVPVSPDTMALLFEIGNVANLVIGSTARDMLFSLEASDWRDKPWFPAAVAPLRFVAGVFG